MGLFHIPSSVYWEAAACVSCSIIVSITGFPNFGFANPYRFLEEMQKIQSIRNANAVKMYMALKKKKTCKMD